MSPTSSCVYPSGSCPPEATAYGYIPNFGANTFFDVLFGLLLVANVIILARPPRTNGIRPRHWFFSSYALLGTTLSFLGSLSRIWLWGDIWIKPAIAVELICNIIAPNMAVGAIYLVSEHVIVRSGSNSSRVSPILFRWGFFSCNAVSIILLVVGGGVATAKGAGRDSSTGTKGGDVVIAGVSLQVVTMLLLVGLLAEHVLRQRRSQRTDSSEESVLERDKVDHGSESAEEGALWSRLRRQILVGCNALAYAAVFIRCLYRIAMFAGGWGNPIMQNEAAFLVLDSTMMAVAWICLTAAHPAFLFPEMCMKSGSQ